MHNQQDKIDQIIKWIKQDPLRCEALEAASRLCLPDWCLAAGFVRNLVWDKMHGFGDLTPLNDIDLIYFDPDFKFFEHKLLDKLKSIADLPWSVKNQARMHVRNNDEPYLSTLDAMSYWVEEEAAVGVRMDSGQLEIISSFGIDVLFNGTITLNQKRPKVDDFHQRISEKEWLKNWPNLKVRVPKYCGS